MAAPVERIAALKHAELTRITPAQKRGSDDFGGILADAIDQGRRAEDSAQNLAVRFGKGDPEVGIHEVMIAQEKANIAVRYAVTFSNRMIEAYKELLRTPL